MKLRVGQGFDFHEFEEGRRLILGGIEIQHCQGLRGHSDADVVLHALADALLGAVGLEDIGTYFPNTDPRFEGVSSGWLLQEVMGRVRSLGFRVGNADVMVLAERPRLRPYVDEMRRSIASLLEIESEDVAVKATTMEGLGTIGRGEGIAALAVVLVERENMASGKG